MIIKHDNNSGITLKGFDANTSPKLTVDEVLVSLTEESTTSITVDDKLYSRHTGSTAATEYDLVTTSNTTATYTSSDPSVGSVGSDGHVSHVSDGTVFIRVNCREQGTLGVNLTLYTSGGNVVDELVGWASDSLAFELNSKIDNAILGTNASTDMSIFSSQNHTAGTYVRNTNNWAYNWVQEMTCISPWNSSGSATRAGTLITRRHIAHAAHYALSTGAKLRFIDVNNIVHERTVVSAKTHPDYSPYYPDIRIAVLDDDLPASISHCKVAPSNIGNHMTSLRRHPCLVLDQQEKALIADTLGITDLVRFQYPTDAKRLEYSERIIGGDSGNPAFMIIDDELILLTVWTYGEAGSGTFFGDQIDSINQLIVDVDAMAGDSTGYSLDIKDLSAYPTY